MIGKRIQQLREQRRLSITELAIRAGVAKSYLSSIERNIQNNPSIEFLHKLALVFGVEIHSLIAEEGADLGLQEKQWIQLLHEVRASGMSVDQAREYLSTGSLR